MITNSVADAALQRGQAVIRELAGHDSTVASEPVVDLASQDTFQRGVQSAEDSKLNRAALIDPARRKMVFHLKQGFDLIRKGRYEQAIDHFQNQKALREMNVTVNEKPVWRAQIPADEKEARQLVRQLSKQNMAFQDQNNLKIDFSRLYLPDMEGEVVDDTIPTLKPKNDTEEAILTHLRHEEALMAAEENIHTYQNMMGKDKYVTYQSRPGDEKFNLPELDIASTFEEHGVPVTKAFIKRYAGRDGQIKKTRVWDLVTEANGFVRRVHIPVPDGRNEI